MLVGVLVGGLGLGLVGAESSGAPSTRVRVGWRERTQHAMNRERLKEAWGVAVFGGMLGWTLAGGLSGHGRLLPPFGHDGLLGRRGLFGRGGLAGWLAGWLAVKPLIGLVVGLVVGLAGWVQWVLYRMLTAGTEVVKDEDPARFAHKRPDALLIASRNTVQAW